MVLNLIILKDTYSIYKLTIESGVPAWVKNSPFYSITRTADELSIVCKHSDSLVEDCEISPDWRILKIQGPLDFSLVGIFAEVSGLLKYCNVSIFTISTYDTDYILVKNQDLDKTVNALINNDHKVTFEN